MVITAAMIQQNIDTLAKMLAENSELTDEDLKEFLFYDLTEEDKEQNIWDYWIDLVDQTDFYTQMLKERRDRADKAYKNQQKLLTRLQDYIITYLNQKYPHKKHFESKRNGVLCLQNKPGKLDHNAPTRGFASNNVIDDDDMLEQYRPFCEQVKFWVIRKDKIKNAIKLGQKIDWAVIKKSQKIKIR